MDFFDGSEDEMLESITRLYNMPGDYEIYPGHNRATTMEYEKRRNRYMRRFK
jgi:glyoxylase-like metal-dependent hydrolase (beta-lactamase superfamily II)